MFPRNGLYSTDSALPQIPQPWPRDNHTEKLSAPFSTSHAPGNIPFQSPRHQAAQSNSSRPPAGFPVMMLHQPPPYPKYPHPHHLLSSSHLHGDSSMTNDTLSASDSGAQLPLPLNLSPTPPHPPPPRSGISADWMQTNSGRDILERFPEARMGVGCMS